FRPASVTCVLWRTTHCKLLSSFNSFSPASVILVPRRSTTETGLPGRVSSLLTRPPSFSIAFTAAASSARPAVARASSPSSIPALITPCCRTMMSSPRATATRFSDPATASRVQGKRRRLAWLGLVADTSAAEGSANNLEPRQCSLEFLYPRIRDLSAVEAQILQALEFLQYL